MSRFNLHLVSDATGETLTTIANAAVVQFESAEPQKHLWPMIRSRAQVDTVLAGIEGAPGLVLYTVVNEETRAALEEGCRRLGVKHLSALDPVMMALREFLGQATTGRPGTQHEMNTEYFERIEAMHYTLAHDDGQMADDLDRADIVLVGVSRSSKTPTSMYLANRGLKVANVPFVPGVPLPDELFGLKYAMVIGLTTAPDRLSQIRRNRLLSLKETHSSDYADEEQVKEELIEAKRLFAKQRWPVIDVTRKSIEETAAAILSLYQRRRAEKQA
ncbi:MAG: pyruvate, water dikinase regulatory protein [Minwuia sp.]|uniref:pyruvate, water dikinase regulatory protein n=1 Tax=Minwuia sp. TaxID=2493630 RepID=UPI003A88AB81